MSDERETRSGLGPSSAGSAVDAEPADGLRNLNELSLPDVRMRYMSARVGPMVRPLEQRDRYEAIADLRLVSRVPEQVRAHYDTARNLYLYAWHVYRFHVVAEHQALASLEMALRLTLGQRAIVDGEGAFVHSSTQGSKKRSSRPAGLSQLMSMAARLGIITNDGLTRRAQWAQRLAEERRSIDQIQFMERNGLDRMDLPDTPAVPTAEELALDWLQQFVEGLPRLRNEYAHGSQMLHANVLRTFQIVCDLINQMWSDDTVNAGNG